MRQLLLLVAAAIVVALFGCERITGVKPTAKPCSTDTTFYQRLRWADGRLDSVEVRAHIDRCGASR